MAKSMRLTKAIRESILNEMLDMKFLELERKALDAAHDIADLAYAIYAPPRIESHLYGLPEAMVHWDDGIAVALNGQREWFPFREAEKHYHKITGRKSAMDRRRDRQPPQKDQRRFGRDARSKYQLADSLSINSRSATKTQKKLAEMIAEHRALRDKIDEDRNRLKTEINAVLGSVTTRKRLIEEWPEIEPTLDRIWPESGGGIAKQTMPKAIAVQMKKLNRDLGLPEPKTKASAT